MLETVAAKELDQYTEEDGVLIVDLRPFGAYAQAHIRNAVNVPQGQFSRSWLERSRGRTLILYCSRGSLSLAVARKLDAAGYSVKSVIGGIAAYRGHNLVYGGASGGPVGNSGGRRQETRRIRIDKNGGQALR